MNKEVLNTVIPIAAVVVGAVAGTLVGRLSHKHPTLEKVALFAAGLAVGTGGTMLAAPKLISKSEAASILASGS